MSALFYFNFCFYRRLNLGLEFLNGNPERLINFCLLPHEFECDD